MADQAPPTLAPESQPAPLSAIDRVFGAFFSPGETFADITRAPGFAVPLALLMISSLAASAVVVNRIGMERIVRQRIEQSPRPAEMSKEQLDQAVERGARIGAFFTYVGPLVVVPLVSLAIAGVLLLMVNFVFEGKANFAQMFGVVTHASLPALLASVLAIVIVFLKDPADVDIQNVVAANLGAALSKEAAGAFLHRVAVSLDLFSFWQMALMATGISAVGKFPFRKSLLAVGIPWTVYVLAVAGWAAITSGPM